MARNYYNTRDSYKLYKKEHADPVNVRTYVRILNGFMKFLFRKLLKKGVILLPLRLGKLQVVGRKVKVRVEDGKIKGLAPDWAGTKKLWKENEEAKLSKTLVYHFNEDTDGVRYKFLWSKDGVLVPNKTLYTLRVTRTNKRNLSKLVKQGKEYYIKS